MCVDLTDINATCPKDPYLFPKLDNLIDGSWGYKTLSLTNAYSSYNQIKMDPLATSKMSFMFNHGNYL